MCLLQQKYEIWTYLIYSLDSLVAFAIAAHTWRGFLIGISVIGIFSRFFEIMNDLFEFFKG